MEFLRMISILLIVLVTTTFPISSSIRSYSKFQPSESNHSEAIPIEGARKANPTGITFPLLHRNHPEIVKHLGILKEPQLDEVTPISYDGLYFVKLFVGSEMESIVAVLDTGSSFSWMQIGISSKTFSPLSCYDDRCRSAPGNDCDNPSKRCIFDLRYFDGTTSKGIVGLDSFHYGPDPSATVSVEDMLFGVAFEKTDYNGVLGMGGLGSGVLKALDEYTFSACFPMSDNQGSYLRIGDDAKIEGASTPLVWEVFGHLAFGVSSIEINGLQLTNLTRGSTKPGGTFIFDTGAAVTNLNTVAMDAVIGVLKEVINAKPYGRLGSYELCYESSDHKAYADLAFSINFQGGGSMRFNFLNLWKGNSLGVYCLAFKRSTTDKTIFGITQMRGWNFGLDLQDNKLYYKLENNCLSVN